MNLLLYGEIRHDLPSPEFGGAFSEHIKSKHDPGACAASLSAWHLLAGLLQALGIGKLPKLAFTETGKPYFTDSDLHFSLSHSGNIAAALLSSRPCGLDIELRREETARRLYARVLSPAEQDANADFFEIWTKKEAAGKLSGCGIGALPCNMDLAPLARLNWIQTEIFDSAGQRYSLSAVCEDISRSISIRQAILPSDSDGQEKTIRISPV